MTSLPSSGRRSLRLLVAAATAVAAGALTVSTAAAAPAPAASHAPPSHAQAANHAQAASHARAASHGRGVHKLQAASLASTISLATGCSASLVRYPTSLDTDRAMMLTNGHCWEGSVLLPPGTVLVNVPSVRTGDLLDASGQTVATVQADLLLYATMTDTDIALYRLTQTFAQIKNATGLRALTIASTHPVAGHPVSIPAGYWKVIYSCEINGFVDTLREAVWTWHDSIRYQSPDSDCQPIGGTSGAPIVDDTSVQIVGINNTANVAGEACTLDNPCEVSPDGTTTQTAGQGYGQETYWITTCLTWINTIDLNKDGCLLPKPLEGVIG